MAINTSLIPAIVAGTVEKYPKVFQNWLEEGYRARLADQMTVGTQLDKTAFTGLIAADIAQTTRPNFAPIANALTIQARIVQNQQIDYDFEITRQAIQDICKAYITLVGEHDTMGDVNEEELTVTQYVIDKIMSKQLDMLVNRTVWRGQRNVGGVGSATAADGLLAKIIAATGVDIPVATNVFAGAGTVDATNAVAQFVGVAELVALNGNDIMGLELNAYCSPALYRAYQRNARNQGFASNLLKENMDHIVDFENIKLKPVFGMSGSNMIVITPKENLHAIIDHNEGSHRFKLIDDVKTMRVGIQIGTCYDVAYGPHVYRNSAV